jgi:hypothetical protein
VRPTLLSDGWAGRPVTERAEFPVEPWCLRERGLNLDLLAPSESLFAMSNGHLRGNLDEGETRAERCWCTAPACQGFRWRPAWITLSRRRSR